MSSVASHDSPAPIEKPGDDVFIARQPIFDGARKAYAYELLFRGSRENRFDAVDVDDASFHALNNVIHLMGLTALTNGSRAFINFNRRLLLEDAYRLLPRDLVVIEILEDVEADDAIVAACRRIKEAGYTIALDDCVCAEQHKPLWPLASIVKVDFLGCPSEQWRALADWCRQRNVIALAEKVETEEHFEEAKRAGYTYFQGYFFCRPAMHSTRDLRAGQAAYVRFLREINAPELDYRRLEETIKQDASLSYKLLRYLNSAAMGLNQRVTSIQQALALLGTEPLRKWGSLIALTGLAENKPQELLVTCLARGRFCERIGELVDSGQHRESLFIMSLLSGLNAVLDQPMGQVLQDVAVAEDIREALLGKRTTLGKIYALAQACERARWERIASLAEALKLPHTQVAKIQCEATTWADQTLKSAA